MLTVHSGIYEGNRLSFVIGFVIIRWRKCRDMTCYIADNYTSLKFIKIPTVAGCNDNGPLGMITGTIEDWQITASSTYPQVCSGHKLYSLNSPNESRHSEFISCVADVYHCMMCCVGVGSRLPRAVRPHLSTQRSRLVRQVQVQLGVAPSWPWRRSEGQCSAVHIHSTSTSHIVLKVM